MCKQRLGIGGCADIDATYMHSCLGTFASFPQEKAKPRHKACHHAAAIDA